MIRPVSTCKKLLLTGALSFLVITVIAADRYSVESGDWNSSSTWSTTSGGAAGASVPVAGDNVFIENGYTVTVTANAACANLTFTSVGSTSTLTVNSSVTLTISGNLTLFKLANANTSCNLEGAGTISCTYLSVGSSNNNPTNNNTTRTHTFNSSIANLNITGDLSINSYYSNNNRRRNGTFNLESGMVSVSGSLTTSNANAANVSTFSMTAGAQSGSLILSGADPFVLSGTGTSTINLNGTSALVNYSRSGAQPLLSATYTNLTLSGSGAKSIPSGLTVNSILSVEGTATASVNSPSYGASSTLRYKGTSAQTTGIELPSIFSGSGGLIIDNSSGVALSASVTLETVLSLTSGVLNVGSNTLTINGAIVIASGNMATTTSSNIVFGGSSPGVSIPSGVTNLRNLTINNPNGVSMNSNITLASGGILNLTNGILNAGSYVLSILNSSSSAIANNVGSFVNVTTGSLQRTLSSGLSGAGYNYLFPIGESNTYKGLNLVDVNTGATGPVLRASVSASGALIGDNSTIGPVEPRYWSLINTNGGNLTSAKIELFETGLNASKTIGMSSAVSGNYVSIGGILNPSSMISSEVTSFGSYFCIGFIWTNTLYSYQTGNWNAASTWTSDPSGTLQIGTTVPGNGDRVIILSDRTVSLTSDVNTTDLDLTIESGGILDQAGYRFTNTLGRLDGQGTLKLSSINFPVATLNDFIVSGGGTTEYYNTSDFTIPSSPSTYNNLTINCAGRIATQLSNLTLFGNMYVKSGTFRINNNIATAKLNLTIDGNVTVDNGASLTVGNGVTNPTIGSAGTGGTAPFLNYYLNFHTVIISGNLINNGIVRFTNLLYPLYTSFPPTTSGATSGAASVYFQGAANNTITCNGPTDFYNLIVNKGTDQTYRLTINSSGYTNFRLFGANSLVAEAISGNPTMRKALWIYSGTLVLKGSIIIPSLSEGIAANADYYIPASGALIIDGTDVVILSTADDYREINAGYGTSAPDNTTIGVTQGGYSSLYVFGKLEINNGFLSTRESGGIVTSSTASGQILINGGTVEAKQLLSSTGSASYTQTDGLFILRGRLRRIPLSYASVANLTDVSAATLGTSRVNNGINTGYGSFNLENTGNIYTVSGGTIRIYDVTLNTGGEAFDVKSSLSNINVTGGTLEILPLTGTGLADAVSFLINSTAPLYDLIINRQSSSSVARLSSNLTVQNDFTLTSGELAANNFNLAVGHDFTLENGTVYTPGTNTTTLNGSGNQTFRINISSPPSLNNFAIIKSAGDTVFIAGTQSVLNVSGNFNLTSGTLNDGGKTINLSGSSVYNSGIHTGTGGIVLNGTVAQTIDGGGTFNNLTLNNTSATAVALAANLTINGNLIFSNDRLFNISTFNLLLNSTAGIVNYGPTRYIQTAGNAGDGGLSKAYSSITAFTFPVGAPTLTPARPVKYTPATIGFTSAPATYGTITIIPVGYEHPATTSNGQSLTYYWRVKSTGFTGIPLYSVTHTFVYEDSDIAGTESDYVPSLYDESSHLWYYGATSFINTSTNNISDWTSPTNSTNFLDADYTAGLPSGFGTPVVYYSRRTGLWTDRLTWSLTSHTVDDPPVSVPGANDIVLIGGQDSVYLPTNNRNPNTGVQNCATLKIESGSALDIGYNPGCTFAMVLSNSSGNGNFRLTTNYNSPSTFAFPSGDFSDFNVNRGTTELYTTNPTAGTVYYMPTGISSYGNLILSPLGGSNLMFPNNNVTIYGNLITRGQNADSWFVPSWGTTYPGSVPAVPKTITIMGDMDIQGGALIWYQNSNIAQNFIVYGNVRIGSLSSLFVYSGATNQSMAIGGNLINNANGFYNGVSTISKADFTNIPLTFFGSTSTFVTNTIGTPSTTFGSVTVNKGNSQATTLTWNIAGTLTTPANNWLTIQNGTLIYDRVGNFTISQGTDFTIPATGGLVINTSSNVYIANSTSNNRTLFLNGRLAILGGGGNVYIGPSGNTANNADIEYSGSGASQLEIQSGNFYINGQIRRPIGSTNGILSYSQTGGNVFIFGNNPTASNRVRSKLEVLNYGSRFEMSGGTLTIVRGGGTTFGDLYLRPASSSVTGGTIIFSQVPDSGPVINAAQSYQMDADIALNNITVAGKTDAPVQDASLALMISPLVLNGSLSLSNSNSLLNSNNINVSIKGNFINNGTYSYGTNLTTFNGGIQSITGTSSTDFYDLDVISLTSLTVNNNFTVNGNLSVSNGNLILGSNRLTLQGNLINNGSYTDDNISGGIALTGVSQQQVSGTGSFGLLDLNNTNGARLYSDINLLHNIILTQGILDINIYQLTLSQNSSIEGAPFGITKMIKSDGVISSSGVKKFFNAGPNTFTFPIGVTGKYTPADFSITANSSVGYIRVNPVNSSHPSVIDPLNALNYYWQLESSGISGVSSEILLSYTQDDVAGTESDYVSARLELPANIWHEALSGSLTDNVDEAGNFIRFVFTSANSLNGDYTAGNSASIPGEVPTYQTNSDGNWSNQEIWTPVGASPPCPPGGPSGAIVIINHAVSVSANGIYVFSTTINNRLRILSPTFGHSIGYVYGNGTLYLEGGNLPGGNYSGFTDCGGNGTIEFGGTGTYTIVASLFSSLPNALFTGTGTRILPNKDITFCKRLVIDGPTLDNSVNNRKLIIQGTLERYNTGIFRSGSGSSPSATVSFSGTIMQTLGGATGNFTGTSRFQNMEMNNPAGLVIGNGGAIEVNNELLLTNGVITTGSSATLTLLSTSSNAVIPAEGSTSSYISGPLTKYIINGDIFVYPLGRGTIKGHAFTLTSGSGSTQPFTAEFFTPNTTATSVASPLRVTNTAEYWTVSSAIATNAKIRIAWDPQSDLTPLMATHGINDMRVAEYISGLWTSINSVTTGDEYNGTVETRHNVSISTTGSNFTSACISGTLARAAFSAIGSVCGLGGIPVTFTSFDPISLNYTLGYTIDNVPQTPVTVSSLPFVLPTPSAGAYKLTSFTYNNGSGTGVVDAGIITAYVTPTTAAAGTDQSLCGLSGTNLAGNNPSPYSGLWTITSGTGGSITSSIQYDSPFSGVLGNTYTLRWTISNGPCTSSDEVMISFPVVASTPGDFTVAPAQVCPGSSGNIFTVPLVAGVTYDWTFSGTGQTINGTGNSVSIDFSSSATGGILSVTATNSCGTSGARTTNIDIPQPAFSYPGIPYCQNDLNPLPVFGTGGIAGTFSSSPGLVFTDNLTGQINLAASVPGNYTVFNTATVAGCGTLTATSSFSISELIWTGAISNDWNVSGNWSCGYVPYPTTHIVIPDVTREPVLEGGSAGTVNNITIQPGSSLSLNNNTLQIGGTISNNGILTASDGVVEMNGSTPQSVGNIFAGNSIRDLIINNSAGVSLTAPLNITRSVLVTNGNLSSAGFLTLTSSASSTAFINGTGAGTITGDVTIQRYLPSGFGYKYFSSPFQDATVNEFDDEVNLGDPYFAPVYRYDENLASSGWVSYLNSSDPLNPLEGYAVFLGSSVPPITVDATGVVNNGPVSATLFNHNNTYTKGFNLVGNPYPSAIDWNAAGWTKTNIDNAVYYFKASTTDEYAGTYSTYINGVSSDPGFATNIIPSMQAFFVHVTDGAFPVSGTLGLTNSVRVTDTSHGFMKSETKNQVPVLRLNVTFEYDTTTIDRAVIYFDEKATSGFDSYLDALKLMNTDYSVPNLYSVGSDGKKLSINALPPNEDKLTRVPLGIKISQQGYIVFRLDYVDEELSGNKIFLTDLVSGVEQELMNGNEYRVFLNEGEHNNRFWLNLSSEPTAVYDLPADETLFSVYSSHGILKVFINTEKTGKGILTVSNLTGQLLVVKKVVEHGYFEINPGLKDGIYFVNFASGSYKVSRKVLIKN